MKKQRKIETRVRAAFSTVYISFAMYVLYVTASEVSPLKWSVAFICLALGWNIWYHLQLNIEKEERREARKKRSTGGEAK